MPYFPFVYNFKEPMTNSSDKNNVIDHRIKGPKTPINSGLTSLQKEIIYGSTLGDLTIERYSLNGNSRLRFFASNVNKDYIFHLYEIFKTYTSTPPKEVTRKIINKLTGHIQTDIFFSTLKYPHFNFAREEFYKPIYWVPTREEITNNVNYNNRFIKVVPLDIYNKLTNMGLAFWLMDDGSFSKHRNYVIICTDSYSKEDVLRLILVLTNKFNLSYGLITIAKNKNLTTTLYEDQNNFYYRIRINKSSLPSLIKLVKPYFIPAMYYKLGL